ncbi:aminotransferase class I/II-fold pyridoxal phosphate-dependent enzyme [Paenibacillus mucilaginosus]|uniref:Aminotransferase n=3 Tax=Paenibacillus mucilaginosus TaxID=61624 RepID=H6NGG6_9BACL|nr:aminotransferase class I/II-fold pyridoxal phosphate-dependent enzyme [Paenibacillus mucilaginosus]AEI45319.1 YugH [Paenibacillus mucilaginosus KNP414]AFC33048.1 YugH [Paenibacillus mucilaginosus 3016]AFH65364.1 aminotransferase A [Paenibacillus mucilaginosus K02]WDM26777.1 aminotransferase class I/II-fold pyridoxal phosphate-dependent enzyme [Paenibacillus mucilaginosus]WFA21487.1 aminotransferase class I/II-fold pyridoxal phosphate-dependent enzyme [Paenibacillus mucilaginosus]
MIEPKQQTGETQNQSMSRYLAPLVRDIPPSGIRKFFDLASGRKDIISLGVGEPDFSTPWHVREACVYSLERGNTKYTPNSGLPELREAIAEYLYESFQTPYEPADEVLVTVGGSEAIDLALRALVTPGDEILIPEPCYVSYNPITAIGGGVPVGIETFAKDQFKLTAESLKNAITPRSKILILCYPSNPTGGIMTYEDWLPIAKVVEEHDLIVISDEIYAELTYDRKHVSFASIPGMRDRTVLVSGFSKAFAMTGWRMGYACGHRDIISAMTKIHQYTVMCAPSMGQVAALEALRNGMEEKDRMVESYNQRRRLVVQGFREIGLQCHEPQGAFYAFPSIQATGLSSAEFAERCLFEAKVAVVPGQVFGIGGEGFVRCSYAYSVSQLLEAIDRIGKFMKNL